MTKCFEDFLDNVKPQLEPEADRSYAVAVNGFESIAPVPQRAEMTYAQSSVIIAKVADQTPKLSWERQQALEQAAVISQDSFIATAAGRLATRLTIIEKARGRIPGKQTVY
jgi:hypothetical protein